MDETKKEIQVQHNIENVAANEANLEAKIEKKKVSATIDIDHQKESWWSPLLTFLQIYKNMTPGDINMKPSDKKIKPGDINKTPGDINMTPGNINMKPGDINDTPGGT